MTRKPKFWTYWILAVSLNLIPLVAQGNGDLDLIELEGATVKRALATNGGSHADPVPAAKPAEAKKRAPKKASKKKSKFNPKAKIDWKAQPLTPNGSVSDVEACNEKNGKDLYDADKKHKRNAKQVNLVHICEQTEWQKTHRTKRPPPAKPTAPEGKTALEPVAQQPAGPAKDLSFAEAKDLIRDFDHVREGDNITGTIKLRGKIFADCAKYLEITHLSKIDSKDTTCANNAAGYVIQDTGGFEACVKSHADAKHTCSNVEGDKNECVFLSKDPSKRKTSMSLSKLPMGEIQIVRSNPDGNEDHKYKCESFPTPIEHISQAYVNDRRAEEQQIAFNRQIETAQRQVKCTRTAEELAVAKSACEWLTHVGHYTTLEECSKGFDKKEIEILKNQALKGPADDLEQVTTSVIEWANNHPNECSKAVDVLQSIAKRHTSRRGNRDSDATPFDGYNAARDIFERAAEEAPCLTEDSRFIAMQNNIKTNRALKICQVGGVCSIECQSEFAEVLQTAYQNFTDTCSSGNWQMDNSCMTAASNFQGALTIPQRAQAEMAKQAQATQQLMAMASQSQQQGGGQFGGSGQFGGNPYGGISPFQVPGANGMPGAGGYSGTSTGSFTMPGAPSLVGSTRPGGGGSSGFGFGAI